MGYFHFHSRGWQLGFSENIYAFLVIWLCITGIHSLWAAGGKVKFTRFVLFKKLEDSTWGINKATRFHFGVSSLRTRLWLGLYPAQRSKDSKPAFGYLYFRPTHSEVRGRCVPFQALIGPDEWRNEQRDVKKVSSTPEKADQHSWYRCGNCHNLQQ